ncbi:MAG: hypothetical protein LBT15_00495, partial [Synergistaceae bacterium]|nr:hypothetical protein [Synergistaceae bacterium]
GQEIDAVRQWILERLKQGTAPHEIGVFVRGDAQLERARAALANLPAPFAILDEKMAIQEGVISVGTMHLAKGLEFKAIVVMACDGDVVPLEERVENVGDEADLEELYNTERHLLYVACTRARDELLLTGVKPVSEFLDDLRPR